MGLRIWVSAERSLRRQASGVRCEMPEDGIVVVSEVEKIRRMC
jgi:hypothetical protein